MSALAMPQSRQGTAAGWRRRWLGGRVYWLCQLGGWGMLAATWIAGAFDAGIVNAKAMIIRNLGFGVCGVIASHLLRLCIGIMLARFRAVWSRALWFFFAMAGSAAAMLGMAAVVAWLVPPFNNPGPYFARFLQVSIYLLAWTGFYFALTNLRNFQREKLARVELDAALKDAEVRALKAQLNPHFLFNCLNSLRALMPLEQKRPREAVTLLADLLRAALTVGEQTTIALSAELATVDTYLALEKIRFEERLLARREIQPESLAWRVPPFLVQSLVENAVKHGVAPREDGGVVTIRAEVRDGVLRVRVTNPGRIGGGSDSTGLGLANNRARLRLLFGAEAGLTLTQEEPDAVVAEARVPVLAEKLPA